MTGFARKFAARLLLASLPALSLAAPASAQCYTYRPRAYATPSYTYHYPYHDNRFQVTYNIAFPQPAVTGSTVYGNTPPAGLSLLDPLEAYRLRISAGQRGMELGAQLIQSADVVVTQAAAAQEGHLKLRLLEELDRFINGASAVGGSTTLQLRASRDAQGNLRLEGSPGPQSGTFDVQAIAKAKCVSCHGAAKKERGLDLTNLSVLDPKYEELILKRILADDPASQMPPPDSGLRLSFEEKMAFVRTSQFCRGKAADATPAPAPVAKP